MNPKRYKFSLSDAYKGKNMPDNSRKVDRSTKYGNPFKVEIFGRDQALELYKIYLDFVIKHKLLDLTDLKGKNLCCSCNPDESCHADILIDAANK